MAGLVKKQDNVSRYLSLWSFCKQFYPEGFFQLVLCVVFFMAAETPWSGKSENNRTRPSGHVTEKARGTQIKTAVGLALYQLSCLPLLVPPNHPLWAPRRRQPLQPHCALKTGKTVNALSCELCCRHSRQQTRRAPGLRAARSRLAGCQCNGLVFKIS